MVSVMVWTTSPAYAKELTATMRNNKSRVKSNHDNLIGMGLKMAIALMTMVEMNNAPPKSSPMLMSALLVRNIPLIDENTSGAPFANANKVTPAKLLPILPLSEIEAKVGEK